MTLPRATDVFVIGGGPAGLAAAIAARRRGCDVVVADGAVPPIDKACGEGLMPDGLRAARSLGIDLETVPSQRFSGIRFRDRDSCAESRFPHGYGLGMRRTTLHSRMVQLAAGAGVRLAWGMAVTGIGAETVSAAGQAVAARWIVGADGGHSRVRAWAGLDSFHHESCRFGFRAHYRIAPWSEFMELHWGDACQLYITPVSADEICVAALSRDPHLRLAGALPRFPAVARRLAHLDPLRPAAELGGVTASRRLKRVWRGRVALVGDASGSVDAITGEGLCLLFQHAAALAAALEAGDLSLYQDAHRRIGRRPEIMANLMLLLDRRNRLRRRVIHGLAAHPWLFNGMLAAHVGEFSSLL
jgi:2-polyprenyl-6-methoxyphenol hydroxylase-like FAD-dependent oxidoreductase